MMAQCERSLVAPETNGQVPGTITGIFLALFLCLLSGCNPVEHPFQDEFGKKELLVYCGATMTRPIMELAALMEQRHDCAVRISYGASSYLQKSIEVNRIGDLFLPGNTSYLQPLEARGIITARVDVGYMELALFVRKGNPKKVRPDLRELLRHDLKTAIGLPDAGSVGRETRYLLNRLDIYRSVVKKADHFGTDSRDLVNGLRHGTADVVLNWRAVLHQGDNEKAVQELRLPRQQTRKQKIAIGMLAYSRHPELARQFLALAGSDAGREIFCRYGF